MRQWATEIQAINPLTGELCTWMGPGVPGINLQDAERYCRENLGYCKVTGELVAEIPTKADGVAPDWDKRIDFDQIKSN